MKLPFISSLMTAAAIASGTLLTCIPVFSQSAYDSRFIEYPTYNGDDLELTVDASGTHFRLWSPKAQEARVNLYDNGHAGKPYRTLEMKPDPDNGTWNASVPQKLYGKFYTFQINWNGEWKNETPGVWAKGRGCKRQKSRHHRFRDHRPSGLAKRQGAES